MLDTTDKQIVELLQHNARISNAEIARTVGLAPSAILERIRKLEERGVIAAYRTILNKKALGLKLLAYIFIRADERAYNLQIADELARFPEVLEVHNIAGEDCYIAKVVAEDTEDLAKRMRQRFGSLSEKVRTRTTIVLETIKEETALPLD